MTLITVTQGLMPFQFEDLTRDERILAVVALGAATIVILHFGLFELPRLWRTLLDEVRRLGQRAEPVPPPEPEIDEQYYRHCLDAASVAGSPWPPAKVVQMRGERR